MTDKELVERLRLNANCMMDEWEPTLCKRSEFITAADRIEQLHAELTNERIDNTNLIGELATVTAERDRYKAVHENCALPGFVDSKNEEKTERNAGYLVVSHSGGGMLRQGTRKGIRRTPANRGMRAHWVVKGLDISEDVCHGMCP